MNLGRDEIFLGFNEVATAVVCTAGLLVWMGTRGSVTMADWMVDIVGYGECGMVWDRCDQR